MAWPLLVLAAVVWGCKDISASNFEVEGTLTVTYLRGKTNQTQNTGYVVSVDGERWLIKTTFGEDYYTWHGCDGTNVYSFLHDPNPPRLPSNVKAVSMAPGLITGGDCPLDTAYYTLLPWLVFASSHYLDGSGDSVPAFWVIPRSEVMAWMYDSKMRRMQSPPQLPSMIEYITSEQKLASAPTNDALKVEGLSSKELESRNDLKTIAPSGFLGGKFSVTSTTNFDGIEVPLTFEATTYGFPERYKSVITNMVFVGKVLRIGHSTKNSYLPLIEQTLSVVDYRFKRPGSRVDCLKYYVKDSIWPSDKDPKLVKEFSLKKDRIPTFEAGTIIRVVFYTVFGVVLLLPFWLFALMKLKKLQRKEK